MGDIEAAIWTLLENNPPLTSNPNVSPFTPAHVTEIVALATAAVGGRIDQGNDDFIPGVGQVVAIVMQPINLLEQTTSQVPIAEIPDRRHSRLLAVYRLSRGQYERAAGDRLAGNHQDCGRLRQLIRWET